MILKWYVRVAYWQQFCWFYAWRWSMPFPWLHRLTIRRVNNSRQEYLDLHRKYWPHTSSRSESQEPTP